MRLEEIHAELAARLRVRQPEIEQAVLTRVNGVAEAVEARDPVYVEGLRAAVCAAIDYGLEGIEHGGDRPPPIPTTLLSQARLAARNGVKLDTVLRRYFAGYTLFGDFVIEEAERIQPLQGAALKRLMRVQAALFDQAIGLVSEEHGREVVRPGSSEERRAERIRRLLHGELVDTSGFAYDFEGQHLALLVAGDGAGKTIRSLAHELDRQSLVVRGGEELLWVWLGGARAFGPADVVRVLRSSWPVRNAVAIGEPGAGLSGWRLSHRQARAALPVAMRGDKSPVRYGEVALLASMLNDSLLTASLRNVFLQPLSQERDGGQLYRETLRAYFSAERNMSAAAALLGINRRTVSKRLRAVEEMIGQPLNSFAAELEAALHLDELCKDQEAASSSSSISTH